MTTPSKQYNTIQYNITLLPHLLGALRIFFLHKGSRAWEIHNYLTIPKKVMPVKLSVNVEHMVAMLTLLNTSQTTQSSSYAIDPRDSGCNHYTWNIWCTSLLSGLHGRDLWLKSFLRHLLRWSVRLSVVSQVHLIAGETTPKDAEQS